MSYKFGGDHYDLKGAPKGRPASYVFCNERPEFINKYRFGGEATGNYGSYYYGTGSLGVLGSSVRLTGSGEHGAGLFYNDLQSLLDDNAEFAGRLISGPLAGTLTLFPNGSFTLSGAPDGTWTILYQLYTFDDTGVHDNGTATATIIVGTQLAVAVSFTSIPSAELHGSPQLQAHSHVTFVIDSIASAEAHGSISISGFINNVLVLGNGASQEAHGSISLSTLGASTNYSMTLGGAISQEAHGLAIFAPFYKAAISRPIVDITNNNWEPIGDATLAACINEVTPSVNKYIGVEVTDTIVKADIIELVPPLKAGRYVRRYMASSAITGVGQLRITLLDANNNSLGSSEWQTLTNIPKIYSASINITAVAYRVKIEGKL